jgi:hypothetical protein
MRELPWKYAREKRFYRLQLTTPELTSLQLALKMAKTEYYLFGMQKEAKIIEEISEKFEAIRQGVVEQ